jgi:cellulose biosynthesis protein BcsQ
MPNVVQAQDRLEPPSRSTPKLGLIYTFYSYKGGVGRSMALANTAALLAKWGHRILVVDWDLEAPGIERFFLYPKEVTLSRSRKDTPGVVDLITAHAEGREMSWRECLVEVSLPYSRGSSRAGSLMLITAGMLAEQDQRDYVQRLRQLDWQKLFVEHRLGECIEAWRSDWITDFDFVLIDSRTGISDIGSICTILFPDVLVLIFTTSGQSIDGIADVMRRSRAAQSKLPVERGRLSAVPVLSREEREKEYTLSLQWISRIAGQLEEYYRDWLPAGITPEDVLRKLYIPQVAYWSFGERLPVVEKEEEIGDSRSIVAAYARLARFLSDQLDWTKIEGHEEAFPEVIQRAELERRRAEEEQQRAAEERRRAAEERRWAAEEY